MHGPDSPLRLNLFPARDDLPDFVQEDYTPEGFNPAWISIWHEQVVRGLEHTYGITAPARRLRHELEEVCTRSI